VPTSRERAGDFSQSVNSAGQLVMISDALSLSGLYISNKTSRTNENFWERGQRPKRFADPRDGTLDRTLHLVALNSAFVPGNNTVLAFRYGYTRLQDDDSTTIEFDPSQLGFSQAFLNAQQVSKFPRGTVADYDGFGAVDPTPRIWDTWSVNGTVSRLIDRHTFKAGAEFRVLGVDTQSFTGGSGDLRFDRFYTSANPLANGTATSGNAIASLLLGYPSVILETRARSASPARSARSSSITERLSRTTSGSTRRSRSTTACASSTKTVSGNGATRLPSASIAR
jgi:hypothetical protein